MVNAFLSMVSCTIHPPVSYPLDGPEQINGLPVNPSAMPKFNMKQLTYAPEGGSISNSVCEIMCDLYNLEVPKLQYHLIMPLGFFLSNHRVYIKNRRILEIFRDALGSHSFLLRNMGLTMLRDILMTFEKAALTESVTGGEKKDKDEEENEKKAEEQKGPSASDSAQPLSSNLDLAMESLLHGSTKIRSTQVGILKVGSSHVSATEISTTQISICKRGSP